MMIVQMRNNPLLLWVLLSFLILHVAACDTNVDPVIGTEQPFSLFGLFSPEIDTQRVLVFPIEPELRLLPNEPLNATFTSTDLVSQEVVVWNDSLLAQENGDVTHMFWSAFPAVFGHDYRVEVKDPSGRQTSVLVEVPPESEIVLQEVNIASDVVQPVLVKGNVPNLLKVEVVYGVDYLQGSAEPKIDDVIISYDDRKMSTPEGWLIRVNLTSDRRAVEEFIRARRPVLPAGFFLRGILIRFIVASEDWAPPDGVFDPDVLVQPGTLSNVENGFGFVGAGYRSRQSWVPADSVKAAAGFRLTPP